MTLVAACAAALLAAGVGPRGTAVVLALGAIHVAAGAGILRMFGLLPSDRRARVGVAFVLGVVVVSLVDEAAAGGPLGSVAWAIVTLSLAIVGLAPGRSVGAASRIGIGVDGSLAVAVALVVCASWYWSLPVGVGVLAGAAIYRALRARASNMARLLGLIPVGGGLVVGWLVRPTYWWLTQQEQLYFDLLASSVSTVGTGDSTFAKGFVVHYHWLSFAWAGMWSRIGDLAPQTMVSRVGPILTVTATVLIIRAIISRIGRDAHAWASIALAALVASTPVGDGAFTWLLGDINHGLAAALVAVAWWLVIGIQVGWRESVALGLVVFAAFGANGMYGLTLVAAIGVALAERRIRGDGSAGLRIARFVADVGPTALATPLAMWYFFGFPFVDSPGNAGVFGKPPFDFVRSISRELEIFTGANFLVVAAAYTLGVVALPAVGGWYALRLGRRAPGLVGFTVGATVAGAGLLIFGHTDTYADQVLCWAAALGPTVILASLAAVEGASRLPRRVVVGAIGAGTLGVLTVIAHHRWGLELIGSGSSTAVKVRALKGLDVVPPLVVVGVIVCAWSRCGRRRVDGVRPLAIALAVTGVASLGVMQAESYRTVWPALNTRADEWVGGDSLDRVVEAIATVVPSDGVVAASTPDDVLLQEIVARSRRRFLVTMPPTASVRELDAEPWSSWRRASLALDASNAVDRAQAFDEVRRLGAWWALLDARAQDVTSLETETRIVHRDERWILVALQGVGGSVD